MKNLVLLAVFSTFVLNFQLSFPKKMPSDFKVSYHLDGGMINKGRDIQFDKSGGYDEKNESGIVNKTEWKAKDEKTIKKLYDELMKLKAFSIKTRMEQEVFDRGGEKLVFTIEGKSIEINNSQNSFVVKEDIKRFEQTVKLVLQFAASNK